MKRKIIKINEDLCTGCGECTTGCAEGALQIIDGKAKLVREDFCDGFGDCIGTCPTGALTIEERETKPFNEQAVKNHLEKTQGIDAVLRMEQAQLKHEQTKHPPGCNCPSSQPKTLKPTKKAVSTNTNTPQVIPSELEQWPVQLHLVNPSAPYFKNKELVVLSTCSPIASPDIHWRFLRGRAVVIACPKLDMTDGYIEKLASIFATANTTKVIPVIMEVPCCKGLSLMVQKAIEISNNTNITLEEHIVSLTGEINP